MFFQWKFPDLRYAFRANSHMILPPFLVLLIQYANTGMHNLLWRGQIKGSDSALNNSII